MANKISKLDGLNFFISDVQGGIGPYLSVYLSISKHLKPEQVACVVGASAIGSILCQLPAGILIDKVKYKAKIIVFACLIAGLSALSVIFLNQIWLIVFSQVLLGVASAFLAPAVAAFSLDCVSFSESQIQLARNSFFNHAGTVSAAIFIAIISGLYGQKIGMGYIFGLCAFSLFSAIFFLLRIKQPETSGLIMKRLSIFKEISKIFSIPVLCFLATVLLFHLSNAAMLPMAGAALAHYHPGKDVLSMSVCVIGAQLIMTGVAFFIQKLFKRKISALFLYGVSLFILPVRGILFAYACYAGLMSMPVIIGIQLLDGVAMGIFSVASITLASEMSRSKEKEESWFGFMQGLVGTATGIGSVFSHFIAGWIFFLKGFSFMFLGLAFIALLSLIVYFASLSSVQKNVA